MKPKVKKGIEQLMTDLGIIQCKICGILQAIEKQFCSKCLSQLSNYFNKNNTIEIESKINHASKTPADSME